MPHQDRFETDRTNEEQASLSDPRFSPMNEGIRWASKITTVGFSMALPPLIGAWADNRWGTSYWIPIGALLGLAAGLWQLISIAKHGPTSRRQRKKKNDI